MRTHACVLTCSFSHVCAHEFAQARLRACTLAHAQGGNHTSEMITAAINRVLHDEGALPNKLRIQFDNASTNKNMLVFAYLGHYVYHGVFEEAPR